MCPSYHQFHVESLLIPSLYIFHYIHSRRKVKLSGKRNERSNDEKTSLSIPIQKLLIPTKFIQFQFSLRFPDVYISFLLFGNIVVSVQMSRFLYQNLIIQYIEFLSATSIIPPRFLFLLKFLQKLFYRHLWAFFNPIIDVTIDNRDCWSIASHDENIHLRNFNRIDRFYKWNKGEKID